MAKENTSPSVRGILDSLQANWEDPFLEFLINPYRASDKFLWALPRSEAEKDGEPRWLKIALSSVESIEPIGAAPYRGEFFPNVRMRFVNGQMQLRRMLAVLNSSSPVLADDRATCKVYSGPWDPPLPLISPDDDVIIDSLSFSCCDDGLYRCEARGRYASNISDVYEFVAEFRVGGGTIFSQPVRREFAGYHTIEIVIAGNSEFIKNHYPQINGYRFTLRDV